MRPTATNWLLSHTLAGEPKEAASIKGSRFVLNYNGSIRTVAVGFSQFKKAKDTTYGWLTIDACHSLSLLYDSRCVDRSLRIWDVSLAWLGSDRNAKFAHGGSKISPLAGFWFFCYTLASGGGIIFNLCLSFSFLYLAQLAQPRWAPGNVSYGKGSRNKGVGVYGWSRVVFPHHGNFLIFGRWMMYGRRFSVQGLLSCVLARPSPLSFYRGAARGMEYSNDMVYISFLSPDMFPLRRPDNPSSQPVSQ